jgi:hypothetical protein
LNLSANDNPFLDVIKQLENTRDCIINHDPEKAVNALTGALLINTKILGHNGDLLTKAVGPFLSLKDAIERKDFDEALITCIALTAFYRKTSMEYEDKLKPSRKSSRR